jgi:hypothetical protein
MFLRYIPLIVLYILSFQRAGLHRPGYVDYQARNQYRPEQAIGRDRTFRTSRRHDNINTVNNRIQRLDYLVIIYELL